MTSAHESRTDPPDDERFKRGDRVISLEDYEVSDEVRRPEEKLPQNSRNTYNCFGSQAS